VRSVHWVAGENLVKIAGVRMIMDGLAARTGMGAVMGSKNLKAIARARTERVPLFRPGRLQSELQSYIFIVQRRLYRLNHCEGGNRWLCEHELLPGGSADTVIIEVVNGRRPDDSPGVTLRREKIPDPQQGLPQVSDRLRAGDKGAYFMGTRESMDRSMRRLDPVGFASDDQ